MSNCEKAGIDKWERETGCILIRFYDMMKQLDSQPDKEEAERKKAVCLIMAMNDIENNYDAKEQEIHFQ